MKSIFLCLVSLLVLSVGCKKTFNQRPDNYLFVSSAEDICVGDEGVSLFSDSIKIEVSTDADPWDWTVRAKETWCRVDEEKLKGYFTVHINANRTEQERFDVITVSARYGPSVDIHVCQSVSPILRISPLRIQEMSQDGGTVDVALKSTASWTAESDKSWVVVSPKSGTGDAAVRVSVGPNPHSIAETAAVRFHAGGVTRKLEIKQDANPDGTYISFFQYYRVLPVSGGVIDFEVKSNTAWSASSSEYWARVDPTAGEGSRVVRVYVAATTYNDVTPAVISFSTGTMCRELTVLRRGIAGGGGGGGGGGDPDPTPKYKYVREGTSYRIAYTIDGNYIRKGTSYQTAYTIDGNYIREGTSYRTAYTIDGNYIREGTSYKTAYTIDGKYIREGNSYTIAYTLDW